MFDSFVLERNHSKMIPKYSFGLCICVVCVFLFVCVVFCCVTDLQEPRKKDTLLEVVLSLTFSLTKITQIVHPICSLCTNSCTHSLSLCFVRSNPLVSCFFTQDSLVDVSGCQLLYELISFDL
jgi:hypothetical protein